MTTPVRRVLIADDDPDIRALLTMTLELSGYSVTEAEDGAQAGELARELQPDLIVADVMMPVTDGFDLLERLKSDEATMDIPVVMLTARASDKDVWRGWQSGASYYLTKPFDPEHLIHFIEHLGDPDGHPLPC
ncbi:MAG TPA: response regulator [Acidimicrobiales bacterium]|jgi:DNA-binding response OmpR family regulator|nr:response regulator [Acidimicrobiales bacterium]